MSIYDISLLAAAIAYVCVSCVYDAYENLSGGRVRKLEETEPVLAEKLDAWLEQDHLFRTWFKLASFVLALVSGGMILPIANEVVAKFGWNLLYVRLGLYVGLVLVLCGITEILQKLLLVRADIAILRFFMPPTAVLAKIILLPLIPLYKLIDRRIEKLLDETDPEDKASLEDEILDMMEDQPDSVEEGEKRMIKGIFDLPNTSVKEIMTPRVDIAALPMTATVADAKKLIIESGHSRIPVYGRSIDEIRGVIYAKDFIRVTDEKQKLQRLIRTPIFVPETKAVDELLDEIKRSHNHFAVIIDEYGGTSGIVTFEDIIEEIVGDVRDEFDQQEEAEEKSQLMPDGSVIIEARTSISDVNEILDIEISEDEDSDTIGGYICSAMGRIPERGETFTEPNLFRAEIISADRRKIQKVRMYVLDEETE
jgi:CBS domain containing-hemolysin-like protein